MNRSKYSGSRGDKIYYQRNLTFPDFSAMKNSSGLPVSGTRFPPDYSSGTAEDLHLTSIKSVRAEYNTEVIFIQLQSYYKLHAKQKMMFSLFDFKNYSCNIIKVWLANKI